MKLILNFLGGVKMEIARAFDTSVKRKSGVFSGGKGLEKGHPVGLSYGKAVPITGEHDGFLGFIDRTGIEGGRVLVITRGGVLVKISNVRKAKPGAAVFCDGLNSFNLIGKGHEIGVFKYVQPDFDNYGLVCFKRRDDATPFRIK